MTSKMKMQGKWVVLAMLPVLSSCGSPPDGRIEIQYMAWGNPQQLDLEKKLCEEFNKQHPEVRVKFFQVPGSEYGNKMIVMLSSGTAPDVMRVDHMAFPRLVKRDYFLAMDDLIANDPNFKTDDFFPIALEEGRHAGKLYGLNVLFGAVIMYYNKSMVQRSGLVDPFELWKKGEWTYDRFLDHAKKMTVKGENGKFRQFGAGIPTSPQILPSMWGFGGEIMDSRQEKVLMGTGKAVAAWQFWYDLRYKHQASPTPSQSANSAFSFESGKLGMTFDWMGMTPRYRDAIKSFEWDVVPLPTGAGGGASAVKGNQLVISKSTKNAKLAWEFVKYMTSEKVEIELAVKRRRTFPSRKSVAYSDAYQNGSLPPFNMRTLTFAVETGRQLPITSRWADWQGEFKSGIENLLSGRTADVSAAAKDAETRANRALEIPEGL